MPITGTFLADFGSFKTAVDAAVIQLKGLETGSGKVSDALNRVAESFSGRKIVQDAELATSAVTQMGGAAVLTDKQAARLNATLTEAIAQYRVLGKEAPDDMVALAAATQHAADQTESLGAQIQKTALAFVTGMASFEGIKRATEAVIAFGISSVEAYTDAEAAQRKLTTALAAQGDASPAVVKHLADLATAYAHVTVNSHTALMEAEALLVQVGGVLPADMDKALKATTDLAAGLGIDLRSATMMVGKAFEDNFAALKKAGVQIDATRAQAEGMTYVLDAINARFGGQARSEAESYAGTIKRVGNAWDELKESVGSFIVNSPTVIATVGVLNRLMEQNAKSTAEATAAYQQYLKDAEARGVLPKATDYGLDVNLPATTIAAMHDYVAELEHAHAILAALEPATRHNLEAAIALGTSTADLAKAFHLTSGEIDLYKKQLADAKTEHDKAATAAKEHAKAVAAFGEMVTNTSAKPLEDFLGHLKDITISIPAHIIALNAVRQAHKDLSPEVFQAVVAMDAEGLKAGEITKRLIEGRAATTDDAHAIDELVTSLDKLGPGFSHVTEPITKLIATLPTVKLQYDALAVATAAADHAHQTLAPDVAEAIRLMTAHGMTIDEATKKLLAYNAITQEQADAIKGQAHETKSLDTAITELSQAFATLAQVSGGAFGGALQGIGQMIAAINTANKAVDAIDKAMQAMGGAGLSPTAKGYAATAITGATVGADLVGLTGTTSSAKGALEGAAGGAASGAAIGAFGGPVGVVAGTVIGGIAGAISGFFKARAAAAALKQANADANASIADLQKQLTAQYGSLSDIDRLGKQVGVDLAGAWGSKNVDGLKTFQALTTDFQTKLNALNTAVQAFGLTWEDLTHDKQLEALTDQATDLATQFGVLQTAGYDTDKVMQKAAGSVLALLTNIADAGGTIPAALAPSIEALGHLSTISDANADALNTYFGHAIATGEKIPPALEPVLQKLIEMGKLTDDNAKAMLGLSTSATPALADVKAAADRYGLSLDQLGGKVEQLQITDQANQMVADWNTLIGAGADVGATMDGMKASAQGLIDTAMKFGSEIPIAMKPMLQSMVDAGELTDAAGNKLTDLSQLHFSEDLTQRIGDLVDALKTMFGISDQDMQQPFDAMAGAGKDASTQIVTDGQAAWAQWQSDAVQHANETAAGVADAFAGMTVTIPINYSAGAPPPPAQGYATGGVVGPSPWVPHGSDTVPAMLTPGEVVLTADDARRMRQGGGGTVIVTLNGRMLAQAVVPEFEGAVRRLGFGR
jgi:hypothetical protein